MYAERLTPDAMVMYEHRPLWLAIGSSSRASKHSAGHGPPNVSGDDLGAEVQNVEDVLLYLHIDDNHDEGDTDLAPSKERAIIIRLLEPLRTSAIRGSFRSKWAVSTR